jgi:hypothetical protein
VRTRTAADTSTKTEREPAGGCDAEEDARQPGDGDQQHVTAMTLEMGFNVVH